MSATATQITSHQGVQKEWVKLFPKEVTDNYTSSVTFIKKLTVVAISTITYLKQAFPEESYTTETFAGFCLKSLNDKCVDDMAQFVSSALQNTFEAFDKKYIHQLALCFYSGDYENLIEYHIFEYSYNSEGVSMNISSKNSNNDKKSMKCSMESVQARTLMLFRALNVFVYENCWHELPLNYEISLRISYNEDTPEDYQVPGFVEFTGPDPLGNTLRSAVRQGHVETPYHKFVARSYLRELTAGAEPSDPPPEITLDEDDEDGSMFCEVNSKSSSEPWLCCPCGKQDTEDQALITCRYCHTQQHAVCFGLMAPITEHCCVACAEKDPSRTSTCTILVRMVKRKQECLCILRRTLALCARQSSVSGEELMAALDLTDVSAARMIRLISSYRILPDIDSSNLAITRKINSIYLKLAYPRFFQVKQDSIVDRVIAETEASDPVEEALGPIQKITLKETNLSTVIDKPETMNMTTPLKEFSELELPNKDISEELPLSGSHNPVRNVPRPQKRQKRKAADDEDWTPKLSKLRSVARKKRA